MTESVLGPFTIEPRKIVSLRSAFTPFVNELLRREVAGAHLSRTALDTASEENVRDGGVDAQLTRAVASGFIPEGRSAWQFKQADLQPHKCKAELAKASFALEILRDGGKYRLVLGADINPAFKERRRKALRETAEAHGIALQDDSLEVLNASDLAEWAQRHPSLSLSHVLGSIRTDVEDFDSWSKSEGASTRWIKSDAHEEVAAQVREMIEANGEPIHIEGVSGLGKSRLALEAVRNQPYESQVVYVRRAVDCPPSLIQHLASENRTVIVIVDECDPSRRKSIAESRPVGSQIRIVTIGEPAPSRSEYPAIQMPKMEHHRVLEIVQANRPGLWTEAVSFVTEIADGNVKLALLLSRAVEKEPRSTAARLITRDIIRTYVSDALPDGTNLLACGALALLTRVSGDGTGASEPRLLAQALQLGENELRAARMTLNELRLLSDPGDGSLSVTPQPLAVYLATLTWNAFEDRILADLMPQLTLNGLERLTQRTAEIGPVPAAIRAVDQILGRTDLFGSLTALREGAFLLRMSAVISPDRVIQVVRQLMANSSDDELRNSPARTGLLWALEILAWQPVIFADAADEMLRLALTGADPTDNHVAKTWCELFGALLPTTAADSRTRREYLNRISSSPKLGARILAVRAAERMMRGHETAFSRVDLQGGAATQPRGHPDTYGEVWDYWRSGLSLLRRLADDPESEVSSPALNALVYAIHPYLEIEQVRSHLADLLKTLSGPALIRVRAEIVRLEALLRRSPESDSARGGLEALNAELPPLSTKYDELLALLPSRTWDFGIQGELLTRMNDAVGAAISEVGLPAVLDLLSTDIQAAFEFGHALGELAPGEETLATIATAPGAPNVLVLKGYLESVRAAGADSIFDDFLDGTIGAALDPEVRLNLTVSGPVSDAAWMRATELVGALPVSNGARGLVGWHTSTNSDRLIRLLRDWLNRIVSQHDYNMCVLFTALAINSQPPWIENLDDVIARLVGIRKEFPNTYQESWDWSQLAQRQLGYQPLQLVQQVVAMTVEGGVYMQGMGDEQAILEQAVTAAGMPAWEFIMSKLADRAWWLENDVRGWLPRTQPADLLIRWIGDDLDRARLAASVINPGDLEQASLVTYLQERFGGDPQVSSTVGVQ